MDNLIKEQFSDFEPELSMSDSDFIASIRRNMRVIATLRSDVRRTRRRCRRALALAALAGMICGVLFSCISPWLCGVVAGILCHGVSLSASTTAVVTWCLIAAISSVLSYTTYDLTLAIGSNRDTQ